MDAFQLGTKLAAVDPKLRDRAEVFVRNGDGHVYGGIFNEDKSFAVPGGGVEPGEDPADAAVRELLEETGIVAENPRTLPVPPATSLWDERTRAKNKAKGRDFDGSRTHFVVADYKETKPRKELDAWGAGDRRFYPVDEAVGIMNRPNVEFHSPAVAVGRAAALRELLAEIRQGAKETNTDAFQLGTKLAAEVESPGESYPGREALPFGLGNLTGGPASDPTSWLEFTRRLRQAAPDAHSAWGDSLYPRMTSRQFFINDDSNSVRSVVGRQLAERGFAKRLAASHPGYNDASTRNAIRARSPEGGVKFKPGGSWETEFNAKRPEIGLGGATPFWPDHPATRNLTLTHEMEHAGAGWRPNVVRDMSLSDTQVAAETPAVLSEIAHAGQLARDLGVPLRDYSPMIQDADKLKAVAAATSPEDRWRLAEQQAGDPTPEERPGVTVPLMPPMARHWEENPGYDGLSVNLDHVRREAVRHGHVGGSNRMIDLLASKPGRAWMANAATKHKPSEGPPWSGSGMSDVVGSGNRHTETSLKTVNEPPATSTRHDAPSQPWRSGYPKAPVPGIKNRQMEAKSGAFDLGEKLAAHAEETRKYTLTGRGDHLDAMEGLFA